MALSVSVVFPTYNRCDVVERTLRHLLDQDHLPIEILVVDNSTDGTPDMVRRLGAETDGRVRLIWIDERLPAVKRNLGLHQARGDLVLFLNDDVWLRTDAVRRHVERHQDAGRPVAVLGHVEQSAEMPWSPFVEAYQPFAYSELAGRHGQVVPWRYFWSMNLSLPRSLMLERNLVFHEDWAEIGHEDVELGYRWHQAGLELVYEAEAWGEHYHPHTLESACRLQASVGRGLRDLEVLIPEPDLLERYGVLSLRNRPAAVARQLARTVLFNRVTVPAATRWLVSRSANSGLTRWMYWKVLLHHTTRAYRSTPARRPTPVPILPPGGVTA
jgi:glycosyltransferase involved in cell wall biosynthesis